MSDEINNLDDMSDDDFMQALDDASYEESNESVEENIEDTDQVDDQEPEETLEAETNEQIDDEAQDSEDDDDYDFDELAEENSQAENDDNEEESEDDSEDPENENANDQPGEEDESKETEELDYKAEYAKILEEKAQYEDFYNKVTGEFVVNGKKTRGFTDPEKIIQSQQMAGGFSEKMVAFKAYRPFMNTLKEKGMLDNPEKFNLAMQLLEGDPEALKKQLKDANIDPFEMGMENINYQSKNQVSSNIEIALDDVMESASQYGVDAQVREIISNDWDDDSVIELLEDTQNSSDLINHISSGIYDIVQDRISEKRRVDVNQVYTSKPAIEQYREAAVELENEYMQYLQSNDAQSSQEEQEPQKTLVQADEPADWIDGVNNQQTEEYAQKVEKQKAKTNEARRKATSLSKKKRATRKQKTEVDPLLLDDDGFTEYMDSLILAK
jgi:hypothetical protein